MFDVIRDLLAIVGAFAILCTVGTAVFVWRLPEAELDDSPLDVVAKPTNVRVIDPSLPLVAERVWRSDEGAVRVDWPAWVAVVGLVAVMALAGWAS